MAPRLRTHLERKTPPKCSPASVKAHGETRRNKKTEGAFSPDKMPFSFLDLFPNFTHFILQRHKAGLLHGLMSFLGASWCPAALIRKDGSIRGDGLGPGVFSFFLSFYSID
jgi:hypothetical protein